MSHSLDNNEQQREPTTSPSIVQEAQNIFGDDYLREEDEMAYFIDEKERIDENVLHVGRKKSKKRMSKQAHGILSSTFQ